MVSVIASVAGVVLAAGYIALARRWPRREIVFYAVGLALVALLYPVWSVAAGAAERLGLEAGAAAAFGAAAWAGVRRPWLLAAGWLAHGAWDVASPPFVPGWYLLFCGVYDVVTAAYIGIAGRRLTRASGPGGGLDPSTRNLRIRLSESCQLSAISDQQSAVSSIQLGCSGPL